MPSSYRHQLATVLLAVYSSYLYGTPKSLLSMTGGDSLTGLPQLFEIDLLLGSVIMSPNPLLKF